MASLLRRDHSSVQGSDLRSVIPQQPETYDLTTEKVRKQLNSHVNTDVSLDS